MNKNLSPNPEVNFLQEKSKDIIKKIINLDNSNKIIFNKIISLIKNNIKNTKNTSKASIKYLGVYDSNFIGVNFDSSR